MSQKFNLKNGLKCPYYGRFIGGKECANCKSAKIVYPDYTECYGLATHCNCCKNSSYNTGSYCKLSCENSNMFEWSQNYNYLLYDYKEPDEVIEF